MSGELEVDLGHCLKLGLNLFSVEGVKEDLNVLLSVKGHSGGLAGDCGREALFNILILFNISNNIRYLPKQLR